MTDVRRVIQDILKEIIDKIEIIELNREKGFANGHENCEYPELLISKQSSGLERCRICFDSNQVIPIIHPCKCKGSIGTVHLICLERWLAESNSNNCELCGHHFLVERVPRYNAFQSIWVWLCSEEEEYRSQVRSLRVDIIRCLVITPLTVVCSYMCMIAAETYSLAYRNSYIMMFILILSYLIWVYLTTQYHHRIWFHWWKNKNIVKILLPDNDELKAQEA